MIPVGGPRRPAAVLLSYPEIAMAEPGLTLQQPLRIHRIAGGYRFTDAGGRTLAVIYCREPDETARAAKVLTWAEGKTFSPLSPPKASRLDGGRTSPRTSNPIAS